MLSKYKKESLKLKSISTNLKSSPEKNYSKSNYKPSKGVNLSLNSNRNVEQSNEQRVKTLNSHNNNTNNTNQLISNTKKNIDANQYLTVSKAQSVNPKSTLLNNDEIRPKIKSIDISSFLYQHNYEIENRRMSLEMIKYN